jgi:hypothetical protein
MLRGYDDLAQLLSDFILNIARVSSIEETRRCINSPLFRDRIKAVEI